MKKALKPVKLYVIDDISPVPDVIDSDTLDNIFSRNLPRKLFKTIGKAISNSVVKNVFVATH
jgi:hypothetical protein